MKNESQQPPRPRLIPTPQREGLDNYDVHFPIGRGVHSFVYRAVHRPTGRVVALKVMEAKTDQDAERIRREVRLHRPLNHPHIVRLLDYFHDESSHYLVLEYCAKGEFYPHFSKNRRKFTENDVRRYLFQTLSALEYLHGQGVIHRDVKMGNLLLAEDGDLKLADFGLSVTFEERESFRKEPLAGTPNYLPPEFVQRNKISFANDLWAVGCFGYALLHGHLPFEGSDHHSTLRNIVGKEIDVRKGCSDALGEVMSVLLDRRYENRRSARKVLGHEFFLKGEHEYLDSTGKGDCTATTVATEGQKSTMESSMSGLKGHMLRDGLGLGLSREESRGMSWIMSQTGALGSGVGGTKKLGTGVLDGHTSIERHFSATGGMARPGSLKRLASDVQVPSGAKLGLGGGLGLPTSDPFGTPKVGPQTRTKAQSIVKSRLNIKSVLDGLSQRFDFQFPRKK